MAFAVGLRFNFSGLQDVSRTLMAVEGRAMDFTPAWPHVADALRLIAKQNFASEGAHGGAPWQGLAASTQADRRRNGFNPGHPILKRSGALEYSLTGITSDSLIVETATSFRFGSFVPWFPYHQSTAPRSRLPRRAPINLTAADKDEAIRPLRVYLRGGEPNGRSLQRYGATFAPTTGGFR